MTTLVIGFGNPLRQDDGLGWHVAEQLQSRCRRGIEVVACHQLTPELAESISQTNVVVFVDARHGDQPGRIRSTRIRPDTRADLAFSHNLSPGRVLRLAGELYGACPPAWMITVDGEAFDHGPELSPRVAAAVPKIVRWVDTLADPEGGLSPNATDNR